MRLLKEEAAAVVIDIQDRLLPHIDGGALILNNCLKPDIFELTRLAGNDTFKSISGIVK